MEGTKELDELLEGIVTLACFSIKESKDGISASDAFSLAKEYMFDTEFRNKINNAVTGLDKIYGEGKDLTSEEMAKIAKDFVTLHLPRILEAIKS